MLKSIYSCNYRRQSNFYLLTRMEQYQNLYKYFYEYLNFDQNPTKVIQSFLSYYFNDLLIFSVIFYVDIIVKYYLTLYDLLIKFEMKSTKQLSKRGFSPVITKVGKSPIKNTDVSGSKKKSNSNYQQLNLKYNK